MEALYVEQGAQYAREKPVNGLVKSALAGAQPSMRATIFLRQGPLPVPDLGFIQTFGVSVVDAFDDLPFQPILELPARPLQFRDAIDHVDRQVETIDLVADRKFQRGVDIAFFLVPAHVNVRVVRSA